MPIAPSVTAISSGGAGYKGIFAHGVLTALETHGFRAAAYAGASAAAIATAAAATGNAAAAGAALWITAMEAIELPGTSLSDVLLAAIAELRPVVAASLASPEPPRLVLAASRVHTVHGATETQGDRAGALGRRLQVHADRNDRAWAVEHLTPHLWDSAARDAAHKLTADNVGEALYASARLLHACPLPAEIDGLPFIDAVYTSANPALEMTALEFREVIAIAPDLGPVYRDLFRTGVIPEMAWRSRIRIIRPQRDPRSLGVEETVASEQGLINLFDHGLDQGLKFLAEHIEAPPPPDPRWNWPKRIDPVPDEPPATEADPGDAAAAIVQESDELPQTDVSSSPVSG